ncbi:MAG: MBL fold metallo-hydrolase [Gammaproteobacteria bacterium]|nr:MBL fold metallo-hydrolase [Gammaproteobacteria bacterium]
MKTWQTIVLVLVTLAVLSGGYVFLQIRTIEVERLSDDLHVLRGFGGNSAVLRTDAGTVVVDTMTLPMMGGWIRELARELTGADTVLLINTHYHLDHTHGNPAFEPGTRILSTERTLSHLLALDSEFWTGDAAKLMPNETFTDRQTLQIGGKTIELIHPGPGHTDGDLVVIFTSEKVIHMGDLAFIGHYPNIDLEAGGTVRGWPATLEQVFTLEFESVIPGHGPTTDRNGLRQFQTFLSELAEIGRQAADEGIGLEDTIASDRLTADAGYEPIRLIVSLGLDREFVLQRAWEEATGNFTRAN